MTFGSVSEVLACPLHPLTSKEEITLSAVENSDGNYIETTLREADGDSTVSCAKGVDENLKVTATKGIATIDPKNRYCSTKPTILTEDITLTATKQKDANVTRSTTKSSKDSSITSSAKDMEFYTAPANTKGSVVDYSSFKTKETDAQNTKAPAKVLDEEDKPPTAMGTTSKNIGTTSGETCSTPTPNDGKEVGYDWVGSPSEDAASSISTTLTEHNYTETTEAEGVNSAPNGRESESKRSEINSDCSEGKAKETPPRGNFQQTVKSKFLQQ